MLSIYIYLYRTDRFGVWHQARETLGMACHMCGIVKLVRRDLSSRESKTALEGQFVQQFRYTMPSTLLLTLAACGSWAQCKH